MEGKIVLNPDHHLSIADSRENRFRDDEHPIISGFRFFNRMRNGNNRIYWNLIDRGMYLLNIDVTNRILIDSLNVGNDMDYSYLFALSSDDSLIYFFHINSNILGGPEEQQKKSIGPSYLLGFRASSLILVDSIPIIYPSLDYGYSFAEIGNCDWVGPYLVYYFFHGEDYRYFSPAMLFIFDTRTNEATWLRVGWR